MGEGGMFPGVGEEVVGLEAEELGPRACGGGEVDLEEEPPFVGYGGGGEGEEVAGLEIVGLRLV